MSTQAKKALEEKAEKALRVCKMWEDSRDGSYELCLTVNGFYESKKLLMEMEEKEKNESVS